MSETNKPAIKLFQIHQEEFSFLGNENIITESSDFGNIWGDFFNKGGYEPILPYAIDSKPINIWYTDNGGEKFYFQGLFAKNVDNIPNGYKLINFPASDFLVVTTEWLETSEEAVGESGNEQCNAYAKNVPIPDGFVRNDKVNIGVTLIEKENCDTPEGSRYEVWVPIVRVR